MTSTFTINRASAPDSSKVFKTT